MAVPLKIDFVSDIVCPWCVIGLRGLEIALAEVGDLVAGEIRFRPFELNPAMPAGGQDIAEHIAEKYGASTEQSARNRVVLGERAAAVGFDMNHPGDGRIYNSFDAHRLLHWAWTEDAQPALKHALFTAYFTNGRNISDHAVLVAAVQVAGLDPVRARAVLAQGEFADDVRAEESDWRNEGVTAVPTVIINDHYIITGGQEPAAFERALRSIARDLAAKTPE